MDIPFSLQGIKGGGGALCQSLAVLVSKLSCIFSSEDYIVDPDETLHDAEKLLTEI